MNKSFFYWLPVVALALGAFACQTDDSTVESAVDPRGDEYTISEPVKISDSRAMELTASHQQFAGRLASEIAHPGQNMVFSPLSIYNFMAMLANGADGQTLDQIIKVLGAKSNDEVVALCRRQFDSFAAIEAKNQEFPEPDLSAFIPDDYPDPERYKEELMESYESMLSSLTKVALANSIWYDASKVGTPYQSYIDECKQWLNAEAMVTDFNTITPSAINQWASDVTNGLIPSIVNKFGPILTDIVCVNALYLNIQWWGGFSVGEEKLEFTNSDGTKSKVTSLKNESDYEYGETADAHFIKLPLGALAEQMTYTIILPKGDGVDASAMLSPGVIPSMEKELISLTMPEFEVESDHTFEMKSALESLGLVDVFDDDKANFSRMGSFKFNVEQVAHKAKIHVSEFGIEAAAATADDWFSSPGPGFEKPQPKVINVDRPFAFRITDNATGMVLFIGTVNRL